VSSTSRLGLLVWGTDSREDEDEEERRGSDAEASGENVGVISKASSSSCLSSEATVYSLISVSFFGYQICALESLTRWMMIRVGSAR